MPASVEVLAKNVFPRLQLLLRQIRPAILGRDADHEVDRLRFLHLGHGCGYNLEFLAAVGAGWRMPQDAPTRIFGGGVFDDHQLFST